MTMTARPRWSCFACGYEGGVPSVGRDGRVACPECGVRQTTAARPERAASPSAGRASRLVRVRALVGSSVAVVLAALALRAGAVWNGARDGQGVEPPTETPTGGVVVRKPPVAPVIVAGLPEVLVPAIPPAPAAEIVVPGSLEAFVFPRTVEEVRAALKAIDAAPVAMSFPANAEQAAAVRRLKAYRYLCGLAHEDLVIDEELSRLATAAADICDRLGTLTHDPPNPGLDEARYQDARRGAAHSNLAWRTPSLTLTQAIDTWMDDSDPANIDRLGHRRWCLNPPLRRVGLGRAATYAAMWIMDQGRPKAESPEMVAFPPAGYVPSTFFAPRAAWSISLNPDVYKVPDATGVTVRIFPAKGPTVDREHPLELETFRVETSGFGLPICLIFRPKSAPTTPGTRYGVEVTGLARVDGAPGTLGYLVEFIP